MEIEFASHSECRGDFTDAKRPCSLNQHARSVGLPTRRADFERGDKLFDRAVLVLGEAPGYFEDQAGKIWVGDSGRLLHRILKPKPSATGFPDIADVYLANTCRCSPPQGANPTNSQIKICRNYLLDDLRRLQEKYKQVFVLCVGAKACVAAGHKSLKAALSYQGYKVQWFEGMTFPTFYTYHPANLLPGRKGRGGRNPSNYRAVVDHLNTAWGIITGTRELDETLVKPTLCEAPPIPLPGIVSLDIETYGILKGKNQTVFHPVKSEYIDRIPKGHQVVCVSLAWENEDGEENSSVYVWKDPKHRNALREFLGALAKRGKTIIGKHLTFDMQYLRYNDLVLNMLLTIDSGLRLDDLELINHLDYELRPEKSLKPLSELLGIGSYKNLVVNARNPNARAKSPWDPKLHEYNATDTVMVLRGRHVLWQNIRKQYGPRSPKFSQACSDFRNELLWEVLYMSESGLPYDEDYVRRIDSELRAKMRKIEECAEEKFGLILAGKGSNKAKRKALTEALVEGSVEIDPERIAFTQKTKEISFADDNIKLALNSLGPRAQERWPIVLLDKWGNLAYKARHYTGPLIGKKRKKTYVPRKGIITRIRDGTRRVGIAYPSWNPVPSSYTDRGSRDEKTRGQIQGRIGASGPPVQTYEDWMVATLTSRFRGGTVLWVDMRQLEYRICALLSGDPTMLTIVRSGRDPHGEAALVIFPEVSEDHPDFHDVYRQVGKHSNFRAIYGGGIEKLREQLVRFVGDRMNVYDAFNDERLREIDKRVHDAYAIHFAWREKMVTEAGKQGYLEVPTGWGRTFLGGVNGVRFTYANECSNFPVQCLSAQLVQSSQYACQLELARRNCRARIDLNEYDAIRFDCPPDEVQTVREIIHNPLTEPPLMAILKEECGRSVPLDYEVKTFAPA